MPKKRKYDDLKELQEKIDLYFDRCVPEVYKENGVAVLDKNGKPIFKDNPPTVAGLALWLGFADRQSLYDYKADDKYSYTIKKAITRIENYAEGHLYEGKPTGAIFWLKNHGWIDKSTVENTGSITVMPSVKVDGKDFTFKVGEDAGTAESTEHTTKAPSAN